MALIRHRSSGDRVVLRSRHLVGRSAAVDTSLQTAGVSGEHAVFTWTGASWELRDLASTNGTFVQGRRIAPGERVVLQPDDDVAFADSGDLWVVETTAAPSVVATSGEALVEGEGPFLALPSLDDPEMVIEQDDDRWVLVEEDERTALADRQTVVVRNRAWVIGLPTALAATAPVGDAGALRAMLTRRLAETALEFRVSGDEEYLELTVQLAGERHLVPPKAHQYLLLVLARARIEDGADDRPDSERGWVYSSDLRKMLRCSQNQFHVMCHRVRREFEALGVADSTEIIERRTTSRQVRIGVGSLTVGAL